MNESRKDSLSTTRLTGYEPSQLIYETFSPKDGVVVFSKMHYPGWAVTIDGKPADIVRTDHISRAMNVPASKHTVEIHFNSQNLHVTEDIAYGATTLSLVRVVIPVWINREKCGESIKE